MKNKFIYTFSALLLSCVIAFSGVGGTYLQARASSPGIGNVLWNEDETAWENIKKYINLYLFSQGAYLAPNLFTSFFAVDNISSFMDFMTADSKFTKQESHDALCGCGNTYTSCPAFIEDGDVPTFDINLFVDGGGGHIRDGISQDDDGNVTISDDVSDLFHDYVQNYLDTNSGYFLYKTPKATDLSATLWSTKEYYDKTVDIVDYYGLVFLTTDSYSDLYDKYTRLTTCLNDSIFAHYGSSFAVSSMTSKASSVYCINDNWVSHCGYEIFDLSKHTCGSFSNSDNRLTLGIDYSMDNIHPDCISTNYSYSEIAVWGSAVDSYNDYSRLLSNDGRVVKIWYDFNALKKYDIGSQSYYYTNNWIAYDNSVDNSITLSPTEYNYYTDNSTTIYQTIQDDIDSYDGELTEQVIQTIVNDAVDKITDTMKDISQGGSVVIPNTETKNFYEKVLDYLDKILKQLKQIKWLNVADLVDDIIANLMEWKSEFEPVVETIMTKFPFSIPWDTMLIFGLLADEPETPRFEFPFVLERFGINEVIVIDLEQFTTLSKISRFLLTLTFLLMLTALTRKISEWFHSSN